MNIADARPEHAPRIASALHRFIALVNRILHEGGALDDDTRVHAGDLFRVIAWCVLALVISHPVIYLHVRHVGCPVTIRTGRKTFLPKRRACLSGRQETG